MSTMDTPPEERPEETFLTQEERDTLKRLMSKPEEFPRELGAWMIDYMGTNGFFQKSQVQGLPLLNTQVQGALDDIQTLVTQLAAAQIAAFYGASEASNAVFQGFGIEFQGPELTPLPAGQYVVFLNGRIWTDGSSQASLVVQDSAGGSAYARSNQTTAENVTVFYKTTLANNGWIRVYLDHFPTSVGTVTSEARRLLALRIGA